MGKAADAAFYGATLGGRLHPKARPERYGVRVIRGLSYGPHGTATEADVYLPPKDLPGPRPLVYFIHGGGFRILSKDTHWLPALMWAAHGAVVVSVNYRLAPKHPFPAAPTDVAEGLCWAIENAHRWGADPQQLLLSGESAGANLTLGLGNRLLLPSPDPLSSRVAGLDCRLVGLLPLCGILQVSHHQEILDHNPSLSFFMRSRIINVAKSYLPDDTPHDLADPLVALERSGPASPMLPPLYTSCGTADPLLFHSTRLADAWTSLGGEATLTVCPDEPHAFHMMWWRPEAKRVWREQLAFARKHLGDSISPPIFPER